MNPIDLIIEQGSSRYNLHSGMSAEATSWPHVENYLKADDRIIIPVGSQEQHGPHLPLGVDWIIPYALSRLLSARTGVFCVSPVCYGMSWLHAGFPGTVALSVGTLIAVYGDIMKELYVQGFRRMMIINGHGGNINALNSALSGLVRTYGDLRVKVVAWWKVPPVEEICLQRFGALDAHAGPAETSVMMHLFPSFVRMDAAKNNTADLLPTFPTPDQIRALYPDGIMQNNPTLADGSVGKEILIACERYLVAEIDAGGPSGSW